ncbi:hypothetical protein Tco_1574966 [Tanacetum coccineum]
MKDAYPAHRGPLPPIVFREPDSGKLQPLPEVQGKGKEKVGEEQAAQVLPNLQTPKKKNLAEQFIFQRRTPSIAEPSGLVESSSLYAELGQEEGQGGTNPGDAGVSQTPLSHVVHAGPNLDHIDLGIAEASSQPNTKQIDDEFTATAYPKVQENLKLPTEGERSHRKTNLSSIIRDKSEKFDVDKAEERTKKKSKQDSPKTPLGSPPSPPPPPPLSDASGASGIIRASDSAQDPPPPPPSLTTNRGDKSQSSTAPGSSKTTASTEYTAWTTTTSRLTPAASSVS